MKGRLSQDAKAAALFRAEPETAVSMISVAEDEVDVADERTKDVARLALVAFDDLISELEEHDPEAAEMAEAAKQAFETSIMEHVVLDEVQPA